jgi:hypothetical protein
MEINDAVESIRSPLSDHPVTQCTQIITEVYLASGLDARQDSGHGEQG